MSLLAAVLSDRDVFVAGSIRVTIDDIIARIEATGAEAWQTEVVRSDDGARNCFFGHLYAYGQELGDAATDLHISANPRLTIGETVANALWEWFEEFWATTFRMYVVNDGATLDYPQETPKARVLALLRDLRDGKGLRTFEQGQADFEAMAV